MYVEFRNCFTICILCLSPSSHHPTSFLQIYTALVGQLSEYDKDNIGVWGASIEAASQAKLKNPLLRLVTPYFCNTVLIYFVSWKGVLRHFYLILQTSLISI